MGAAESTPKPDFDLLNLYEVLEVDHDASSDTIRRAYRKSVLEHHPDKNPDDADGATRRFVRVREAYETLLDEWKRESYDRSLQEAKHDPASEPNINGTFSGNGPSQTRKEPPSASSPQTQTWYEWLFGTTTTPSPSPGRGPSYHNRFLFSNYSHMQSFKPDRDPGISVEDIVDFVKALPESWGMEDDHGKNSLFTLLGNFYQCLALDEKQWGSRMNFPLFGCAHSVWSRKDWERCDGDPEFGDLFAGAHEVKGFYDFWTRFETAKSFEWVQVYREDFGLGYVDGRAARLIRKKNKVFQDRARREYNELIRIITRSVLESDPRHLIHLIRQELISQRRAGGGNPNQGQSQNQAQGGNQNQNRNQNRKKKKKKGKNTTHW